MTDTRPPFLVALDEVSETGIPETASGLIARIILFHERLIRTDPQAAADLLKCLCNGWHGPRIVH